MHMKKASFLAFAAALAAFAAAAANADDYTGWQGKGYHWQLVFSDEFDGSSLNTYNWSRIPYVNYNVSDWRKYQSTDDSLVEVGNGSMTLWGKYGDYTSQSDKAGDNDTYACGGVYTLDTFTFQHGYVEVRAMYGCAQGVWPAIWLMPKQGANWPAKGEIDMMEHLNWEGSFHQTLHYNNSSGTHVGPSYQPGWTDPEAKLSWHTYGMEWSEGKISFYLDGSLTKTFTNDSSNWPFDLAGNEFYLIIDQQIGGTWVEGSGSGGIAQSALKEGVPFDIDYVHVYSSPEYEHLAPEPAPAAMGLLALAGLAVRSRRRK